MQPVACSQQQQHVKLDGCSTDSFPCNSSSTDCVSVAGSDLLPEEHVVGEAGSAQAMPYLMPWTCRVHEDLTHSMCMCRTLLAREHQRVRGEYEERLRELERERQGAEEDKAQVRSRIPSAVPAAAAAGL